MQKKTKQRIWIAVLAVALVVVLFFLLPPAWFSVTVSRGDAVAVLPAEEIIQPYRKPDYVQGQSGGMAPSMERFVDYCDVAVQGRVLWARRDTVYNHPVDGDILGKSQNGHLQADVVVFTMLVSHQLVGERQVNRIMEFYMVGKRSDDFGFSPGDEIVIFLRRTNGKANGIYTPLRRDSIFTYSRTSGVYALNNDLEFSAYDGQNMQTLLIDIADLAAQLERKTYIKLK